MRRLALLLPLLLVACNDSSKREPTPAPAQASASTTSPSVPQLNPEQFNAMTKAHPEAVILDVRTPEEFAAGHIDGAVNMNVNAPDFDANVAKLDKTKPHLVYCRTGRRSTTAANKLVASQIPTYHLAGGITAWQQQKLPDDAPVKVTTTADHPRRAGPSPGRCIRDLAHPTPNQADPPPTTLAL